MELLNWFPFVTAAITFILCLMWYPITEKDGSDIYLFYWFLFLSLLYFCFAIYDNSWDLIRLRLKNDFLTDVSVVKNDRISNS